MVEDGEDSIQDILELTLSALQRHHFHKNAGRVQEEVDVPGDHTWWNGFCGDQIAVERYGEGRMKILNLTATSVTDRA